MERLPVTAWQLGELVLGQWPVPPIVALTEWTRVLVLMDELERMISAQRF